MGTLVNKLEDVGLRGLSPTYVLALRDYSNVVQWIEDYRKPK